eukprot:12922928-Ditylum_brightwellii.AAC.1
MEMGLDHVSHMQSMSEIDKEFWREQHASGCQSGASRWTQYTMYNMQLFIWGTGRAAYAFWSLVWFPWGYLGFWGGVQCYGG